MHIPQDGFLNLIFFDYADFIKDYPCWNKNKFSRFLYSHSLIITDCSLKEFTDLLLKEKFPYWQKGGIDVSVRLGNRWIPLKDIVSFPEGYSLEEIVFLGLGMDGMSFTGISEGDFIKLYFNNRNIKLKRGAVKSILNGTDTAVRIRLNEKN